MGIANAFNMIFELIIFLLFLSVILTWIPTINWRNEPFRSLRGFSEIFFAPFRKVIPPIGMIDISPIVAFIFLGLLKQVIIRVLIAIGL